MHKLPLWRTVGAAYAAVFGAPAQILRIGWLWFALMAGFEVWRQLGLQLGPPPPPLWQPILFGLADALVVAFGAIAYSVAWYRATLVGEDRSWLFPFRFRRREWRVLGTGLLVALLPGVPLFAVSKLVAYVIAFSIRDAIAAHDPAGVVAVARWWFVIGRVLFLAAWFFWSRLLLALPAASVDRPASLSIGWDLGQGSWLRLFAGSLLCLAPFVALELLVPLVLGPNVTISRKYVYASGMSTILSKGDALHEVVAGVINLLELTILLAFYSCSYRLLASRAAAAAPEPVPAE